MATSSYSSFFPAVTPLKVLILGSGGREHAIAHHLLKDSDPSTLQSVHICPGNGGTGPNSIDPKRCFNLDSVVVKAGNGDGKGDFADIVKWSIDNKINFLIPGPEQPLVDGVEEAFRKVGIPVFGPSPLAAQMEGSKTFSKHFMSKHSIPTADFQSFSSNQVSEAISYIESLGGYSKVVLKASGLAGGKGVLLPESSEEAKQGVEDILVNKVFGSAGSSLLIESRLIGPELSVLVFSDGYKTLSLPGCQDHKRILEGDLGPNTGGMGAYSPAPEGLLNGLPERIQNEIVQPSIDGMRKDGFPFVGLLFIGLMLTPDGPKVLEYNVRFGDPETEAVLDLLEIGNNGEGGANLLEIFKACTERRLDSIKIKLKENVHSVSVVLASKGYPGKYSVGKEIQIQHSKLPKNVNVFHAGTKIQDGKLVTAGGRVLVVTAFGSSLKEACDLAYQGIEFVEFEGKTFRKDIAHRALKLSSEISSSSSSTTTKGKGESMTYSSAGVDVDEGNALVEAIKPLAKSTKRLGCDSNLGGFGGTFDLKPLGFKDPILVSGTDGVGTKLRVALDCGLHDTVGIDLVAMSVNDLLVQGALPLYFLDYFACSTLKLPIAVSVISGIAEGCRQSKCGLIGGETAEMPGMYVGEEYDLAGFAVGAVERSYLLPRLNDLKKSDVLIGLRSSGIHSNGFSLVRKIVKKSGLTFKDPIPFDLEKDQEEVKNFKPKDLGSLLLNPTRIYVEALEEIFKRDPKELGLKALCHITGGGFTDNLPRILPDHLNCKLDLKNWKRPEVFGWVQKVGNVESREMARTFNNGIGMVLAVEKGMEEGLIEMLKSKGERPVVMGEIDERGKGEDQVLYQGFESWE